MPAIVKGEHCRVAQVSGVGTLPEYRLHGLNRKLHEIALAEALPSHRFVFLFADDEAIPFYLKCGFRPVQGHAVVLALPAAPAAPAIEKLDLGSPAVRDMLFRVATTRAAISHELSTHNPKLLMYHLLYRFAEHTWWVPALDAILLMKRGDGRTIVYDILASELPDFDELVPVLASEGAREVEFRFPLDRLRAPPARLRELQGQNIHVMGDFPLGPQPVFPFTSQA